jgi:hypothetical protein
MFIDRSGMLGMEHARDLRRESASRVVQSDHRMLGSLLDFVARGHLGPVDNYVTR